MNGVKYRDAKINQVRESVYQKYGDDGIKVLNLASTGQLSYILEELSYYSQKNKCDMIKLCKVFNYVIMQWKQIALFMKNEDTKTQIEKAIKKMVEAESPYFFVFSMGKASKATYEVIAQLNVKGYLLQKKYMFNIRDHGKTRENYAWVFEHRDKDILDFMPK